MSDHESQELSPLTRRQGAALIFDAVSVFSRIHRRISLSQINTFLHVATHEGLTVAQLAELCGISGAVMSRHLGDLGAYNRRREPGLGLVAMVQQIHGDRRERRVVLTDKGVAFARQVAAAMRGGGPMANSIRRRRQP
ncbi:transcriptional regulator [Bradyrhizobium diazoefficiens]|nr:hypothetical protein BD122_38750 [Bradyrhizobium diazoefficiens]KOY06116.1 hypothetical protein AF336_33955 [Bradyrhizobium diazoefficiens]